MFRASWAGICVFCVAFPAGAQLADSLAATSFEHYPSVDSGEQTGQLRVEVFRASAGAPIRVAERTTLLAGVAYELVEAHPSRGDALRLHAPKAGFGVVHGFSERWGAIALVEGGFASDLSAALGSDDLLLSLTAIGTYQLSQAVQLGAGAVYDRRTGRLAPLPALLLNLRPWERLRIRGFAPVWLNVEYRTCSWLDAGVRATFEGNRFHIAGAPAAEDDVELAYSNLTLGPKLTFHFSDFFHLDAYAAYAAYRRYEVFRDDESSARYELSPVLGYGARFWVAPSGW